MTTHKQHSQKEWSPSGDKNPDIKQLSFGCLQRIADATEVMAVNHTKLIDENKWLSGSRKRYQSDCESLQRSNASLRGHITRLKNKIESMGGD